MTAGPEPPDRELRRLIPDTRHVLTLTKSAATQADVVDICTPHHLHLQQILEMQHWPVAMLVEKPLVTSAEGLRTLKSTLRNRRYPILMRTNKRFEKHVSDFLDFAKKARHPLNGRVKWLQNPTYMAQREWYRYRSISGGGIAMGMGIHYLDLIAELSRGSVVRGVVLRTHRNPPNAPDTTSENYAKIYLSSRKIDLELQLSAWKERPALPSESISVFMPDQRRLFRRRQDRDVCSDLSREFLYYRSAVLKGHCHPRKGVIIKAHELALSVYEN